MEEKKHKIALIIFIAVIAILILLSYFLPDYLGVNEYIVERYLMIFFAFFLTLFLIWIR